MHQDILNEIDHEVLDLGLVYYKNIIKDPAKVIELVENLDSRYRKEFDVSEEKIKKQQFLKDNLQIVLQNNNTSVLPWMEWNGDHDLFCMQKFIPKVQDIPKHDVYLEEQLYISSTLFNGLEEALQHYTNNLYGPYGAQNIRSREQTMHLLKYTESGYLPPHQDQGDSTRILSALLYLNDDYEGGEIEFPNSNVRFKPEAGSVIMFPSNFLYIHQVHPITKGTRYSLPNWYHNSAKQNINTSEYI